MRSRYKTYIKYITFIAVGFFLLLEFVINKQDILSNISYSVTITTFISIVYANLLWKYNPLEKIPRLFKNYEGLFNSNYDNESRKTHILIKQNLFQTQVFYKTEQTESNSITSEILCENGHYYLYYTYRSEPKASVRGMNDIHYGSVKLRIVDSKLLEGNYWTDRETTGQMTLNVILPKKNHKQNKIKNQSKSNIDENSAQ